MKILITGSKGMLAKSVINEFKSTYELICTDKNSLDITNKESVINVIKKDKPEYIINCAAYTAVDNAETDFQTAKKINSIGPKNLSIVSNKYGSTLIHISTDYVFSGELNLSKTYNENDSPSPVTAYGLTKLKGERNIIANCSKYYIFRTAWLYGNGKNFVNTMLTLGKKKTSLNIVCDQFGSPTYTVDLAHIIRQSIENKIPYGIYHATNQGFTNWSNFAKKIFELSNINCNIKPVSSEEYIKLLNITQAKRPKNSKLSKQKIEKFGIKIPYWEDSLKRYLSNYERNFKYE